MHGIVRNVYIVWLSWSHVYCIFWNADLSFRRLHLLEGLLFSAKIRKAVFC